MSDNPDRTKGDLPELARRMLLARRRITTYFPTHLFADPVRDMLLDLFVAGEIGREVSVSSACIAANVPATTALRWIKVMQSLGLLVSRADPRDGRRVLVYLTDQGRESMANYLKDADRQL